jgi:hypothetical protein
MLSPLKYWFPAILVALLISLFSTHYFSGEETARVIIPLLHWLYPAATPHMLRVMHVGIRKLAHVTEFGLFSITVFHGICGGRSGWRFSWALATLVIAVAYASMDTSGTNPSCPCERPAHETLRLMLSVLCWHRFWSGPMPIGDGPSPRRHLSRQGRLLRNEVVLS